MEQISSQKCLYFTSCNLACSSCGSRCIGCFLLLLRARARHGRVCLSAVGPCNADACNDTIPLGINRLPLLALPPSSQKKSGGKVGKEGGSSRGNLSAACFGAIKTTEVELLPKRKAGRKVTRKEWDDISLPSERSEYGWVYVLQKCSAAM